jgi:hypothetical protein
VRRVGRRFGALVGVVAATLCGGLTLQTAEAVPMAATFDVRPIIPIAESVLGGTGTATGITMTGTAAAGLGAAATTTVLATAAFFGSYYGTTTLLHWAFDAPETPGTPPAASNWADLNGPTALPWVKIGGASNSSYVGQGANGPTGYNVYFNGQYAIYNAAQAYPLPIQTQTPAGWTFPVLPVVTANGTAQTGTLTFSIPAWRCKNATATCSGPQVQTYDQNGWGVDNRPITGFADVSASSGPATTHTVTLNFAAKVQASASDTTYPRVQSALVLTYNPDVIEFVPAPLHRWRVIITCKNKTSGVLTTNQNVSAQFSEDQGGAPAAQVPQCSVGYIATKVEVWEGDPTGAGGILRYGWTAPPDAIATTPTSPYKSCYPGGSDAPCVMSLWKVLPDGTLKDCNTGTIDCTDFSKTTSTTQTYRCLWGIHSMPISDCSGLEQWAKTTTQTQPTTSTSAQPTTTTTTTVQALPTTGQNIDPKTGLPRVDTTGPAPDGTDSTSSNCMGGAWSWNPVNWVLIPVKCALQWAFVPQVSSMQSLSTRVTTAVGASAPGQWVGAVDGLRSGLNVSEAGCRGPFIPFVKLEGGGFYPLDACSGVMAQIAGITKTVLTVVISLFGGLACLRALGSGLGWSPGVGSDSDD